VTRFDYAVLVFYFVFILTVSWMFRRFVSNVSDYFRGGGRALWWMVGGSAFMVQFSAWTFTGAASKAYSDGWPIAVIYVGNAIGFVFNAIYFAPKFRQMRVVTFVEAVRARFGKNNEHIFTWLQLPTGILQAGIWLNALGVFFSAVFGLDLTTTIVVTGAAVLFMSLISGSWGVLAGDFIQMLILMPVCIVVTVLSLAKIGGVGAFVEKLPPQHLDFSQVFSREFLGMWIIAMLLKQFLSTNNVSDASRYLCVKDSKHARWAGYLGASLFLVGIVIWFIPPMAAAILHPDLKGQFALRNPADGAFIAIAQDVLPVGMMGLLVSGIFASTISTMDAGLNRNAGIFIKNFYQPVLRPHATDQQLLKAGKIATVLLGALVIFVAWRFSQLQKVSLFSLTVRYSALISTPFWVPLLWGMLVKETPPWSGWTTVLVGFCTSLFATYWLTPADAAQFFGITRPLGRDEMEYWEQGIATVLNLAVGTAWFFGTKVFWDRSSAEYKARVQEFFANMHRPVDFEREEGPANDGRQEKYIGRLCLVYGAFVGALALIPNPLAGRIGFLFCGGLVGGIGLVLVIVSKRKKHQT
jgi:SSS family transporter